MAQTDDEDVFGDALQDHTQQEHKAPQPSDALATTTQPTQESKAVELREELPAAKSTVAKVFQKISMEEQRQQATRLHSFLMEDDKDYNALHGSHHSTGYTEDQSTTFTGLRDKVVSQGKPDSRKINGTGGRWRCYMCTGSNGT